MPSTIYLKQPYVQHLFFIESLDLLLVRVAEALINVLVHLYDVVSQVDVVMLRDNRSRLPLLGFVHHDVHVRRHSEQPLLHELAVIGCSVFFLLKVALQEGESGIEVVGVKNTLD